MVDDRRRRPRPGRPPSGCTGSWSSAATSRRAPRSCSSRGSCAAPRTSASGRRRSPPASPRPCAPTTGRSAPTAATTTRWPAARRWAPILAELFGRGTGLLGGKGGSMHLTSVEHGVMGSYAIVGAHLPIALGRRLVRAVPQDRAGRGLLLRRRDDEHRRVPRGAQHGRGLEGAGRVRVREQPVHGVHADRRRDRGRRGRPPTGRAPTAWSRSSWTATTPTRCTRGRAPSTRRARAGEGPSLIEALTYRHGGHSRADPGKYRPGRRGGGLDGARPDPALSRAAARRRASTAATLDAIEAETRDKVAAAEAGGARGAPSRTAACSRPRSGPMGAPHGGTDGGSRSRWPRRLTYSRGRSPRASRRRWSAIRAWCSSARTSGAAGGVFKLTEGLFARVRRRSACATRRSASRPSSVRRWARR